MDNVTLIEQNISIPLNNSIDNNIS
jgi:hypothetical protein